MEMTFYNPSGQLTFSADAITYGYIGRATPQGIYGSQPTNSGGSVAASGYSGYGVYTIAWAGDIIVALPVKTNGATVLLSKTRSGNVWTINVFKSNGTLDPYGADNQEYTEVYVFGAPPPGTTSQFMTYDENGNPSGDLSRLPLLIKGLLSLPEVTSMSSSTWTPPSSISSPAIVGGPPGYNASVTKPSTYYLNQVYQYAWKLESSGAISRVVYLSSWSRDDVSGGNSVHAYSVDALVTTCEGL